MRIFSYNVNGIRSALNKGLFSWLKVESPDILCLQELKAQSDQIDEGMFTDLGYKIYWHPAVKRGYSGVAILSKIEPDFIELGCGMDHYDQEGRILRADFPDFSIMSLYIPSGSSGDERQAFKMKFLNDFLPYVADLRIKKPRLIISGDFNICHRPIDIHNPVSNKNSSGFLPEEREWVTKFLEKGFIDTFRYFNDQPHQYTWWSFRFNARLRNLGWRIDYHMATEEMQDRLVDARIFPDIKHSDHCPVMLEIN
ncbi:MAG: exodeoxyribonuclease III [Cyclobacteriaceae bacterium]|nr:exodeoxyribonuclease III [Cyclobacteriaceae bacterium]